MPIIPDLYGGSLALLTDLYQITMAQGYFKSQMHEREGAFHLTFRKSPFESGYTVACGLHDVIEYLRMKIKLNSLSHDLIKSGGIPVNYETVLTVALHKG